MADDYSGDIKTTGRLGVGGSAKGNFESSYDSDWYRISLTAGSTYIFSLSGSPTADGTLSNLGGVSMNMQNAQGGYAPGQSYSSYVDASGVRFQFTAQSTGDFFLSVGGGYYGGSYTLRAAAPAADDYSADTQTTAWLQAGGTLSGNFERADDVDWVRFHVEANQIVIFNRGGNTSPGITTPTIMDSSGKMVSYSSYAPFVPSAGGDYYAVLNAQGAIGAYTETMQVITDDYSSDGANTGNLVEGGQASGKIDYYNDADRFTMNMQAGQVYTITLKPQGVSASNWSLQVTAPEGGSESANYTSSGEMVLRYQATSTGVYSINVGATTVAAYQLTASTGEADDYGNTRDTAAALTLGSAVSGEVQTLRDVDMFKIDLKAGVTYRFDVAVDGTSRFYFGSSLSDSMGQSLASLGYSNNDHYNFTPTSSATYYLAQSASYAGAVPAAFTLKASLAADDFSANAATTGRLAVGGARTGNLEDVGDRDWIAVSLSANTYYWFNLDGTQQGGGTLNPSYATTFNLRDSSGTLLASAPQSNYSSGLLVPFTTQAAGTYYLEVGGSASGTYTVRAQLGRPDDYGSDQAHAATLAVETPLKGELEVTTDKDVFKLSAVAGMTYYLELSPQKGSYSSSAVLLDVSGPDGPAGVRTVYNSDKVIRVFEAGKTGDYFLTVSAQSYSGWTGTYTLAANAAGVDDYAASVRTAGALDAATPAHGVIHVPDDHDWFKVHLDAGRTYVFDLKGSVSGGGTLDTGGGTGSYNAAGMSLFDGYGYTLASSTMPGAAAGSDPRIRFQATSTGDFYLDVHGTGNAGNTGSYTVQEVQTNLDTTGPTFLSSSLADGAANVSLSPRITLTFDETIMLSGSLNITDGYGVVVAAINNQSQVSVAGNTLTVDPHVYLMPGMTYTVDMGSVVDLAGNPASDIHDFSFTVTKPVTKGTDGNDYLIGSGTSRVLDGGAGRDTAYYASTHFNFTIVHNADGSSTIKDYRAATGTTGDKLINIERMQFSDVAYALDVDGVAGQAYRLYQAAFNRTPDQSGLGFWISAMDQGMSLHDVANDFLASPEFVKAYGTAPSNADFVKLLYQNVLHRAPDAVGNQFWLDALNTGTSRADVLASFSESPENHAALTQLIGNGFAYTPYTG